MLDQGGEVGPFGPGGAVLNDFSEAEGFVGHAGYLLVLNSAQEIERRPGGFEGYSDGHDV